MKLLFYSFLSICILVSCATTNHNKPNIDNIQNRLVILNQAIKDYSEKISNIPVYKEYTETQMKLKKLSNEVNKLDDYRFYKSLLVEKKYLDNLILKNKRGN